MTIGRYRFQYLNTNTGCPLHPLNLLHPLNFSTPAAAVINMIFMYTKGAILYFMRLLTSLFRRKVKIRSYPILKNIRYDGKFRITKLWFSKLLGHESCGKKAACCHWEHLSSLLNLCCWINSVFWFDFVYWRWYYLLYDTFCGIKIKKKIIYTKWLPVLYCCCYITL